MNRFLYTTLPIFNEVSPGMVTDLYQISMMASAFMAGEAETPACFAAYFRRNAFGGGYTVSAGLEYLIEILQTKPFDAVRDIPALRDIYMGALSDEFLQYLAERESWGLTLDAIPEGEIVFPNEPIIRVTGPYAWAQLFETVALNVLNSQMAVATKAARIRQQAGDRLLLEFGLRRAPDLFGANATRAAYIGGFDGTSNVVAGQLFGIPVRGTHAHSWVMFFEDEATAFQRYADAFPGSCIFLVDTYQTLHGVAHAIEQGEKLRAQGMTFGIRLDSGDLSTLSREARRMLDEAGFFDARIVVSDDLDEYRIRDLLADGAPIDSFGVGTKVVAPSSPLGAVYKLKAVSRDGAIWQGRIKKSETIAKISRPGRHQVLRRIDPASGTMLTDLIFDIDAGPSWSAGEADRLLLSPVFDRGKLVDGYVMSSLQEIRERTLKSLATLPEGVGRLDEPETYPVVWDPSVERETASLLQRS